MDDTCLELLQSATKPVTCTTYCYFSSICLLKVPGWSTIHDHVPFRHFPYPNPPSETAIWISQLLHQTTRCPWNIDFAFSKRPIPIHLPVCHCSSKISQTLQNIPLPAKYPITGSKPYCPGLLYFPSTIFRPLSSTLSASLFSTTTWIYSYNFHYFCFIRIDSVFICPSRMARWNFPVPLVSKWEQHFDHFDEAWPPHRM